MTVGDWISFAPEGERFIPLTYAGTSLYDRESNTTCFASPDPAGRRKFRALFRTMSMKARALGYRKAP